MESGEERSKVCPQCKELVYESDSECTFCGYVFEQAAAVGEPLAIDPGGWPKTYRYKKWGLTGLYFPMVLFVLMVCVGILALFLAHGSPGAELGWLVIAGAVPGIYFFLLARNGSVTLEADRVEWTTAAAKRHSILNAELTGTEKAYAKTSQFIIARSHGFGRTLTTSIECYDELVAELKRRIGA